MSYLEMRNITKRFPGVLALDNVSLQAEKGEVHAIAGENGAGKSTLMKILSGAYIADAGSILLDGKEIEIKGPRSGREQGIAIIYQELSLIPHLSIAENIFLGSAPGKWGAVNWREMNRRASQALERLGFPLDPTMPVRSLSIVQQQAVEIARIIVEDAKIVVMDEPTALLPAREVQTLFRIIEMLRERGVTVLYISHRMSDIFELSQHITVLKDGKAAGTVKTASIDQKGLVRMMIGRDASERVCWSPEKQAELDRAPLVLSAKALSCGKDLKEASFDLREGEILGIAGLVGSGKSEIIECIFGAAEPGGGSVAYRGKALAAKPAASLKSGIGFLPADRKSRGLVLGMTIRDNITLTSIGKMGRGPLLDLKAEQKMAGSMIERLRIKCFGADQTALTLSGGNQQKVVMGKWLLPNCNLLMFDEPTRGIDVGARAEIYELMSAFSRQGGSIIVVSSDTQELLIVCDRILVVSQGRISANLNREEATEEKIVQAMF